MPSMDVRERTASEGGPYIQKLNRRAAATTKTRVKRAMATSPIKPTAKGRRPCLRMSRKLVRRPTPAKVSRKAQRERFARLAF